LSPRFHYLELALSSQRLRIHVTDYQTKKIIFVSNDCRSLRVCVRVRVYVCVCQIQCSGFLQCESSLAETCICIRIHPHNIFIVQLRPSLMNSIVFMASIYITEYYQK